MYGANGSRQLLRSSQARASASCAGKPGGEARPTAKGIRLGVSGISGDRALVSGNGSLEITRVAARVAGLAMLGGGDGVGMIREIERGRAHAIASEIVDLAQTDLGQFQAWSQPQRLVEVILSAIKDR